MELLHAVATGFVPSLCAACGRSCRPQSVICNRCARRLADADPVLGQGPAGLDRVWSSAPHEGTARDLVTALKFRRLMPVADLMADRIQWLAPANMLSGAIVPVPTASLRTLKRGFDPATELAMALADRLDAPFHSCLVRRGGGRQLGKRRAQRIANPPDIHPSGAVPRSVLLIDDVLTTGSTLSACARALRQAGAIRVVAITFARRL